MVASTHDLQSILENSSRIASFENGTGSGRIRLRGHRCLAPLSGLDYVTPSLVAIAARKVYPHRIILTVPERDRSLQYGSELAAVKAMLEGVTPEVVIEGVLTAVEAPL